MDILNKLTENSRKAILDSREISRKSFSREVLPEHLFVAIIQNRQSLASRFLSSIGVNLDETIKSITLDGGEPKVLERVSLSDDFKYILNDSYALAHEMGHVYIGTEHLLLALLKLEDIKFVKDLNKSGLSYGSIKNRLLAFANYPPGIFAKSFEGDEMARSALGAFGKDVTKQAREGKLLPIIGRDAEIDRMIKILSRRTKNNPILIGDSGVGKTAVVEGLAQRIVTRQVPESMKKKRLISLDIASIVAGTKVRGELEEKLLDLINEVISDPDVILFIDEIQMIAGSSQGGGSGNDIANILKPVLTDPLLMVIGATTYSEYKRTFDEDEALRRRFQPIDVEEVNAEDAIKILEGLRGQFESFHQVKILDEALKEAVILSSRYIADRYLPDKAIDLIDESAATIKINREKMYPDFHQINEDIEKIEIQKENAVREGKLKLASKLQAEANKYKQKRIQFEKKKGLILKRKGFEVKAEDVKSVVAKWTGIPVNTLTHSDKQILRNIENILSKEIIGQDLAISKVASALKRARVDIADKNKPLSSFLFLGPTGVGKTETAKMIAKELFGREDALIQIDMSELMEKHSVAKLIGSPPGYIGYQEGGQLTEKVRRKPYSVVLFDEVEKAHIDVLNVLLQILEEGRLTDGKGRMVSFRNSIIIMTSNIGAEDIGKHKVLGFDLGGDKQEITKDEEVVDVAYDEMRSELMLRLKDYLRPEFLNRLDEIIIYRGLNIDDAVHIVDIIIDKLNERLKDKNIEVSLGKKEKRLVAEYGFSEEYGARPLKRAVSELIESPLADLILDKGENLGKIEVVKVGEKLELKV